MDKIHGRGPGWVFLRLGDDPNRRWYRIETVDLLAQFDSPSDLVDKVNYDVVDYTTDWRTRSGAEASSLASIYCDLY